MSLSKLTAGSPKRWWIENLKWRPMSFQIQDSCWGNQDISLSWKPYVYLISHLKYKKWTFLPLENKKIGFLVVLIISMFGRSLNIRAYGNFDHFESAFLMVQLFIFLSIIMNGELCMATPFTPSAGESGCMDVWFPVQHKEAKVLISTKGKIDVGFLQHLLLKSLMFGAPSFLLWKSVWTVLLPFTERGSGHYWRRLIGSSLPSIIYCCPHHVRGQAKGWITATRELQNVRGNQTNRCILEDKSSYIWTKLLYKTGRLVFPVTCSL